jgi:MOSC domain-containing protein YiiM
MGQLLAVCVGQAQPIPGMKAKTGIFKEPVEGPVHIEMLGIPQDAVLDKRHHGGRDQAIYVYFQDDYDWWAGELNYAPQPGLFGENLTIAGANSAGTAIGDCFAIGDVLLEVTYYRQPCVTFSAKMGDPRWLKRFQRANCPGAYCRVLQEGPVTAGMGVTITPYAGERITVSELMALDGKEMPLEFIRRAVTTPIREKTRFKYEMRLADLF